MSFGFCTTCGGALDGSKFCTSCGAAVSAAVDPAVDPAAATIAGVTLAKRDSGMPTPPPIASPADVATVVELNKRSPDVAATEVGPRTPGPPPVAPMSAGLPPLGTLPPPVAGLPPVFAARPLSPVPQPKARKSPLPWILVGALLAVGAGATTTYLLWPKGNASTTSTSTPTPSATVSVSTGVGPGAPTPTTGTTTTAAGVVDDASVVGQQIAILQREISAHASFYSAVKSIDQMCPKNGSGSYDPTSMDSAIQTLKDYVTTRASVTSDMRTLAASTGGGYARKVSGTIADLWAGINPLGDDFVRWAEGGRSHHNASGTCALDPNQQVPGDTAQARAARDVHRKAAYAMWLGFAQSAPVDPSPVTDAMVDPALVNGPTGDVGLW